MEREKEVNNLDSQLASRRKVQTWGGGRDSGLGGRVAPSEPLLPQSYHSPVSTSPLHPMLAPLSEAKRWGAVKQIMGSRAWGGSSVECM